MIIRKGLDNDKKTVIKLYRYLTCKFKDADAPEKKISNIIKVKASKDNDSNEQHGSSEGFHHPDSPINSLQGASIADWIFKVSILISYLVMILSLFLVF